jgi:putative transposase
MFSEPELERYFNSLCDGDGLPIVGREFVRNIRSSAPGRLAMGGNGSVPSRFANAKMGWTIQSDSDVEFALVNESEFDDDVIEIWDQIPNVVLQYKSSNGRSVTANTTSDYLFLRSASAAIIECKGEAKLVELAHSSPNRFQRDANGKWRCPPGEAFAAPLGLTYEIWSSANIDANEQRWLDYLHRYLCLDLAQLEPKKVLAVRAYVEQHPGLTLSELYEGVEGFANRSDVNALLAKRIVFFSWHLAPPVCPDEVHVFPDKESVVALERATSAPLPPEATVDIAAGAIFSWNGNEIEIVNVGPDLVAWRDNAGLRDLPAELFEKQVAVGKIILVKPAVARRPHPEVIRIKQSVSPKEQDEFARRKLILDAVERGETVSTPRRTLRRWREKKREAKELYGDDLVGLYPNWHLCGRYGERLTPAQSKALSESITEKDYETDKAINVSAGHRKYCKRCEEKNEEVACYSTYLGRVNDRPKYPRIRARKGRRAAYRFKIRYWRLERDTPRHGDRPWQIAHIDHTECDVECLVYFQGRLVGEFRPWLTVMVDAYSRKILALSISFNPPSYLAVLEVVYECIRRHHRLPECLIVDRGAEFRGKYFQQLAAHFRCHVKFRPPAESRFGGVCERIFGTANTVFFYTLAGNTQITHDDVRQVTKSHNPKNLALWTLEALDPRVKDFAYEAYDILEHPALGQSPRQCFEDGNRLHGEDNHLLIPDTGVFPIELMPTTVKESAKINSTDGVKLAGIWYWNDRFTEPGMDGLVTKRPRWHPYNAGLGYVYVKGQWLECRSEQYGEFYGRTRKEIAIMSRELRKRALSAGKTKRGSVTTKILAGHMKVNDIEEARLQYTKDQALAAARGGELGPAAASRTASAPTTAAVKHASRRAVTKIIDSVSNEDMGKF